MTRFTVDSSTLAAAARTAGEIASWSAGTALPDLPTDGGSLGHDGLANALGSFRGRWTTGISELQEDVSTISALLDAAATEYLELDASVGDAAHDASASSRSGGGGR
ncbi:hypothetical protein SAMN06295974_2385 [Plantibacter flavus]|uniref:Excreted virulence factor EspC (Type VII ESX diderm) n=1 Tax=Plantibacter flavus TaxID=150123 RepID=A0A3N2BYX6_9MICO|nr:hypothetical protein [Plantibacter flavus]ROR80451.1 hypothetical protein EDD42_0492 [Plantibacter flavus]SMG34201.1 hypothetical protein SAMN06295974_2385 [Plantibacter flavus]